MTWTDVAINVALDVATMPIWIYAGALITRRSYRDGFERGRAVGFAQGKVSGLRESNDRIAEAIVSHETGADGPREARAN